MTKSFFVIFLFFLLQTCRTEIIPQTRIHPKNATAIPSSDEFYSSVLPSLKGKKVMLVTNPSGIGRRPERIQKEFAKNEVTIEHLIGLEHGFLGLEEEFSHTPVTIDSTFGRPLYHIYKITDSELKNLVSEVDAIVFDVQDVGMRCYTYLSVLKRIMDASANLKTQVILLDHIHVAMHLPPRGQKLKSSFKNFAGEFPSLLITGMTLGESALFYNKEYLNDKVNLQVLKVKGFQRIQNKYYEETGLSWNTPSPNLPMADSARNYLALVMLEGVNVSVGRGTQAPFVYFGAPWMLEPQVLADKLDLISKDKFYFTPVFFKPTFGPHKGKICHGLRMNLVSFDYDPIELAYVLISSIKELYPKDFKWNKSATNHWVDNLWGSEHFRTSIDKGIGYLEFSKSLENEEAEEKRRIQPYLIY